MVHKYLENPIHPDGSPVTARTPWAGQKTNDFDRQIDQTPEDEEFFKTRDYRGAVGSLQHAQKTRSGDIGWAVGKVAAHAAKPRKIHWAAIQRILAYLNGSSDMGLTYRQEDTISIEAYSDADWAANTFTRKSVSGTVITINCTAVVAQSKSQTIVADSTVVAETIALTKAAKTLAWVRNLVKWFGGEEGAGDTPIIWCDNKGAVRNA